MAKSLTNQPDHLKKYIMFAHINRLRNYNAVDYDCKFNLTSCNFKQCAMLLGVRAKVNKSSPSL